MKHKLIILFSLCYIAPQCDISPGYESTVQEEELQRRGGSEHDADVTAQKEAIANLQNVADAALTENQENIENLKNVNDAYSTSAQEAVENLGDNASPLCILWGSYPSTSSGRTDFKFMSIGSVYS